MMECILPELLNLISLGQKYKRDHQNSFYRDFSQQEIAITNISSFSSKSELIVVHRITFRRLGGNKRLLLIRLVS